MQKKAYRVLEEMCGAERDECKSFVVSNLETLKIVLLDSLKNASSPAKRVNVTVGEHPVGLSALFVHLTALFLFFSAETQVSDPHREKVKRGAQRLHHCAAARGTDTNLSGWIQAQAELLFLVFYKVLCPSGDHLHQGGFCWSS